MQSVQFSPDLFFQLQHIHEAMPGAQTTNNADFAHYILELRHHYLHNNQRYFAAIKELQSKNPSWITIEFLKTTPPAHLSLDKLRNLYELTSKVYLDTINPTVETKKQDEPSLELASWLYDMLKQIEQSEAQQTTIASVAKGVITGAVTSTAAFLLNPVLAPIGLFTGWAIKRLSTLEPTLQDRPRIKEPEYIRINDYAGYLFEPESSGLYGRHIRRAQSYTLGEIQVVFADRPVRYFFNLNHKHKISPSDIAKLHFAMLEALDTKKTFPEICLLVIEALETPIKINGSDISFLDSDLVLGLQHIKQRSRALIEQAKRRIARTPEPNKIVNVSGHKNGCGLYSFTLACIKAHKNAKALTHSSIPEYVLGWDESFLLNTNDTETLDQLNTLLRSEIAAVIKENSEYRATREQNFMSACLNVLAGGAFPSDMQTFYDSNQEFIFNIETMAADTPYQLSGNTKSDYEALILSDRTKISEDDIICMQAKIIEYFAKYPKPWQQKEAPSLHSILPQFANTPDPFIRAIQQRKLLTVTLASCPDLEQRLWWKEETEKWLEHTLITLLDTTPQAEHISVIKRFGLLSSTNFEGDGQVYSLPNYDDIIDAETMRLLLRNLIHAQWPSIFSRYVDYVKNEPVMLTADELMLLAKKWKVSLNIFEWRLQNNVEGQLKICLTNPKQYHWQVYLEE